MTKITYVEKGGAVHVVDVPNGVSLMDGAKRFTIPGVDGDCGGACACGTCHVYIDGPKRDLLPPMHELERDMLEFAFDVRPNSRLACQIKVNEDLEGLIVTAPARQY